jgi:hypothetical protein
MKLTLAIVPLLVSVPALAHRKMLVCFLLVGVCCVAPASGADAPRPTIIVLAMRDGSVRVEGERYTQPELLNARLLEISQRFPPPELQVEKGEADPCYGDPFGAARDLLRKTDLFKSTVFIGSCISGVGGPAMPLSVPTEPLRLPN